jgi:hypothetical protein
MTLKRKILSMALQFSESNDVINKTNLVIYQLHTEFYMSVTYVSNNALWYVHIYVVHYFYY